MDILSFLRGGFALCWNTPVVSRARHENYSRPNVKVFGETPSSGVRRMNFKHINDSVEWRKIYISPYVHRWRSFHEETKKTLYQHFLMHKVFQV